MSAVPVFVDTRAFHEPVVKRSLKEPIAEKIAGLIASGILQIGDALPSERDLASSFRVSRETVRGAVQRLASQGVLEISQGARTRVARADVGPVTVGFALARAVDAYDLDSVHAARLLIESRIVADAARWIDDKTLAQLDEALDTQRSAVDDPVRFLISDREFHTAVYASAKNRLLSDFAADLYAYMMSYRRDAIGRPGAIQTSIEDHVRIVDALRRHEGAEAARAFGLHTERIYETTMAMMAKV